MFELHTFHAFCHFLCIPFPNVSLTPESLAITWPFPKELSSCNSLAGNSVFSWLSFITFVCLPTHSRPVILYVSKFSSNGSSLMVPSALLMMDRRGSASVAGFFGILLSSFLAFGELQGSRVGWGGGCQEMLHKATWIGPGAGWSGVQSKMVWENKWQLKFNAFFHTPSYGISCLQRNTKINLYCILLLHPESKKESRASCQLNILLNKAAILLTLGLFWSKWLDIVIYQSAFKICFSIRKFLYGLLLKKLAE